MFLCVLRRGEQTTAEMMEQLAPFNSPEGCHRHGRIQ